LDDHFSWEVSSYTGIQEFSSSFMWPKGGGVRSREGKMSKSREDERKNNRQ
jgi:hypothetical protein